MNPRPRASWCPRRAGRAARRRPPGSPGRPGRAPGRTRGSRRARGASPRRGGTGRATMRCPRPPRSMRTGSGGRAAGASALPGGVSGSLPPCGASGEGSSRQHGRVSVTFSWGTSTSSRVSGSSTRTRHGHAAPVPFPRPERPGKGRAGEVASPRREGAALRHGQGQGRRVPAFRGQGVHAADPRRDGLAGGGEQHLTRGRPAAHEVVPGMEGQAPGRAAPDGDDVHAGRAVIAAR